jgi:hypothetical protein
MLSNEEKKILHQAFDLAIKSSPDSMAAANVLMPLYFKIASAGTPEAAMGQGSPVVAE